MLRQLTAAGAALLLAATSALAQVEPFPSSFRTENVEAKDVTIHVRVRGARDLLSSCSTAMAKPAICGRRWRPT